MLILEVDRKHRRGTVEAGHPVETLAQECVDSSGPAGCVKHGRAALRSCQRTANCRKLEPLAQVGPALAGAGVVGNGLGPIAVTLGPGFDRSTQWLDFLGL